MNQTTPASHAIENIFLILPFCLLKCQAMYVMYMACECAQGISLVESLILKCFKIVWIIVVHPVLRLLEENITFISN